MLDPQLWRPPIVIAHRGSRELWPENTMVAFAGALELGVEHLETDVHVSSDGIVHCFHDHTLARISGAQGMFIDSTAAEIAQLDAGQLHQGPEGYVFRGQGIRIPTFEELVTSFPEVRVVVDLKHDEVVEPFARLVARLGIGSRLIVGSFADRRIEMFRSLVREPVPTSTGRTTSRAWLISSRAGRGVAGPAKALQLPLQMRGLRVIDRRLVDVAHDRGLQVHAWTVNDAPTMNRLREIGVDGFVTDRPDIALAETRR